MGDRLTFLMNLGQALQLPNALMKPRRRCTRDWKGGKVFTGAKHPGYVFGLEPLAEVTFQLGKTEVALEMMTEVVGNFWTNGHPRRGGGDRHPGGDAAGDREPQLRLSPAWINCPMR